MKGALLSVSVGAAKPASVQAATLRCAEAPSSRPTARPTVTLALPTTPRQIYVGVVTTIRTAPPVPLGAVSEPVGERSDVCWPDVLTRLV